MTKQQSGRDATVFYSRIILHLGVHEPTGRVSAGKSGKIPYRQLKEYFRENVDETVNPNEDNNPKEEDLKYFYHPDHLGSSAYVTDVSGEVHQHTEYFPFGETMIDERPGKDDAVDYRTGTPYLFNGKELDEEMRSLSSIHEH